MHAAMSLIPGRLYYADRQSREKLVTQKVRLRVINGEESLSPERLFGARRKGKGYLSDLITGLKLL